MVPLRILAATYSPPASSSSKRPPKPCPLPVKTPQDIIAKLLSTDPPPISSFRTDLLVALQVIVSRILPKKNQKIAFPSPIKSPGPSGPSTFRPLTAFPPFLAETSESSETQGIGVMTPDYAEPEQILGETVRIASDI